MGDAVLELEGVTKRYGGFLAVDRVSLLAPRGKILGLLGPNGAGKTSTLRMILGITPPDEGKIVVFGKAVYRPSGRLLRIDADKIEAGSDADQFFGKIPPGVPAQRAIGKAPVMNGKGGVNAIFGKWPGSETDEQVAEALRRLS